MTANTQYVVPIGLAFRRYSKKLAGFGAVLLLSLGLFYFLTPDRDPRNCQPQVEQWSIISELLEPFSPSAWMPSCRSNYAIQLPRPFIDGRD